ncbi:MAG: response regulator transcription factor [Kiritimatiellae bacterium]|nr:response regulator transcription factor [Kiritimatiellia bacterium]
MGRRVDSRRLRAPRGVRRGASASRLGTGRGPHTRTERELFGAPVPPRQGMGDAHSPGARRLLMDELAKILVVEDDSTIRTILEMALLGAGFKDLKSVARGDEGLAEARRMRPDLVLLDLMLPGLDGFTVATRIRETPELAATRIIMLTARTQNEDIVRGLACGADDYVTKPFDRLVLLARVRAVLRRGLPVTEGMDFDGLRIDETNVVATLRGKPLDLTPGEFKLLVRLVAHRGRVFARPADERTIDVQVASLRRKLGRWGSHIETVRGVGYRVQG